MPPTPVDPPKAAASRRLALTLSAVMLAIYAGFILLVAYQKPLLGQPLVAGSGISIGILLGVLVILAAWVLTFVYARSSGKR